jgi:uncharacterized protein involved in exopolysaccharide biosynthesis
MPQENYTSTDYLNAFRRRLKVFLFVFIAILAVAVSLAVSPSDFYRSAAEFRVDLEGPNVNLLEAVALTNYADQYVSTLERSVVTADNLRAWLAESNAFAEFRDEMTERELINLMRNRIRLELVFTSVIDERAGREVELITGFRPVFTGFSPEATHSVAKNLAEQFLAEDRSSRTQRAAAASSFFLQQIEVKEAEIAELEKKAAQFKEENAGKLPELLFLNMTVLERTERDLENIQTEIQSLQNDRIFRQSQLEEIRQNSASAERLQQLEDEYVRAISLYGPDHPDVIRIKRQVAAITGAENGTTSSLELEQLRLELAEAQQRYSEEHPDIRRLRRRIESLESGQSGAPASEDQFNPRYLQLRANVNAIDAKLASLRTRSYELRQKLEDLEVRIASTPEVERQYQALDRELQTAKLAFNDLRQRLTQAQQTESFEAGELGARLALVSAAYVPDRPAGPRRLAITILGVFMSISLAAGIAIAMELMDSTVRGRRDILTALGTQPIVAVPVIENSVTRKRRYWQFFTSSFGAVVLIAIIYQAVSWIIT